MLSELKKEYKKLTEEREARDRRIKAIESVIREYKTWVWPSQQTLSDLVIDCLMKHDGHAEYASIVQCLEDKGIAMPRLKISSMLGDIPAIKFDRVTKEWKLVNHEVLERVGNDAIDSPREGVK